jgi:hypothetical protein
MGILKVTEMPAETRPLAAATDELLYPSYWLVSGLDWQGDAATAEAAAAIAPAMIPRAAVSHDARQVLGCADLYSRKHSMHVVFFSDLTRMFAIAGTSWTELGVDWENGLDELHDGAFPLMLLTVTRLAYLQICNPASRESMAPHHGAENGVDSEREAVRQAITQELINDWPGYMRTIIATGHVRQTC